MLRLHALCWRAKISGLLERRGRSLFLLLYLYTQPNISTTVLLLRWVRAFDTHARARERRRARARRSSSQPSSQASRQPSGGPSSPTLCMPRPPLYDGAAIVADVRAGNRTADVARKHGCTPQRVRQLCVEHGVTPPGQDQVAANAQMPSRPPLPWVALLQLVCGMVYHMGHSYGYRQIWDRLAPCYGQFHISRRAVKRACMGLFPLQFAARRGHAMRRLLRGYFYAPYVGYSMYIDANCKLQEYGVYVSGAQDGKSRCILSLKCVTDLLMCTVYTETWLPAVATLGFVPDQVRVGAS